MDYTADIAKLEAQIPEARDKERGLWLALKKVEQDCTRARNALTVVEERARSEWSKASLDLECMQRVVEAFKTINADAPEPAAESRGL